MNITESKIYQFTFQAGGTQFNFGIPATSLNEACTKLRDSLSEIGNQLEAELLKQQTQARAAH
jgi:hypothetical protein